MATRGINRFNDVPLIEILKFLVAVKIWVICLGIKRGVTPT